MHSCPVHEHFSFSSSRCLQVPVEIVELVHEEMCPMLWLHKVLQWMRCLDHPIALSS